MIRGALKGGGMKTVGLVGIILSFTFFLGSTPVFGADNEEEESEASASCEDLEEKISIIIDLHKKVNSDFIRLRDPSLCASMSKQCEYFYEQAKSYQKQYRDECDDDYEIAKVDKCDYSENPCVKRRRQTPVEFQAGM